MYIMCLCYVGDNEEDPEFVWLCLPGHSLCAWESDDKEAVNAPNKILIIHGPVFFRFMSSCTAFYLQEFSTCLAAVLSFTGSYIF